MFLEYQIVGDEKKNNETQSSLKIPIIPTLVSPLVVHDDHGGVREDNSNDIVKPIEQAPPKLPTPLVELELRRSTRKRRPSTRYPPHEYVTLTNGGKSECFEETMSHQYKSEWVKAM